MPKTIPINSKPCPADDAAHAPHLGAMLCADTGCAKRCAPSVEQIAAIISGDNVLSAAVDMKITSALREYAGERFAAQASRMDGIEAKIDLQAAATRRVENSTAGIVEIMESWGGAMKTIERTGKVLKPITWIIGFFTALLALWAAARGVKGD